MYNKNILNEIWFALIWKAAYLTFILWNCFEFEIGSHHFTGIAANLLDSVFFIFPSLGCTEEDELNMQSRDTLWLMDH